MQFRKKGPKFLTPPPTPHPPFEIQWLHLCRHIEVAQSSVCKVNVKFSDEQAGSKAMRSFYSVVQNSEVETSIKRGLVSPFNKHAQFPLKLSRASTAHKVQSLRLEQDVIDFDQQKQKSFGPGQTYTQIKPSDSTSKIIEALNFFNTNFDNNENKFLRLTFGCTNDIATFEYVSNGVSLSDCRNMLLLTEYSL